MDLLTVVKKKRLLGSKCITNSILFYRIQNKGDMQTFSLHPHNQDLSHISFRLSGHILHPSTDPFRHPDCPIQLTHRIYLIRPVIKPFSQTDFQKQTKRQMYNGNIDEKMLAILYGFRHFYSVAPLMFWKGMVEFLKLLIFCHAANNFIIRPWSSLKLS
jgi:hypothetical protein